MSEAEHMRGYVILPIFTVEMRDSDFEMTCNRFFVLLFLAFFAPFWDGKIHVVKEKVKWDD